MSSVGCYDRQKVLELLISVKLSNIIFDIFVMKRVGVAYIFAMILHS